MDGSTIHYIITITCTVDAAFRLLHY